MFYDSAATMEKRPALFKKKRMFILQARFPSGNGLVSVKLKIKLATKNFKLLSFILID